MLTAIIYDYEYTRDIVDDDGMHQVGERRRGRRKRGVEGEKKFQKARVLRIIKRHHIREKRGQGGWGGGRKRGMSLRGSHIYSSS